MYPGFHMEVLRIDPSDDHTADLSIRWGIRNQSHLLYPHTDLYIMQNQKLSVLWVDLLNQIQ